MGKMRIKSLLILLVLLAGGAGLPNRALSQAPARPSEDNNTRLLRAAETGQTAEVDRLLEAGADPNASDSNEKTALMFAAEYEDTSTAAQGASSQAMVRALLNRGAKFNAISRYSGTALMQAVAKNNDGAVKLLLEKGATVHVAVVDKDTVIVSSGDLKSKPAPQLRLRVEETVTEGQWLPANDRAIGGLTAWKRPTNAHYRKMLALLKAASGRAPLQN